MIGQEHVSRCSFTSRKVTRKRQNHYKNTVRNISQGFRVLLDSELDISVTRTCELYSSKRISRPLISFHFKEFIQLTTQPPNILYLEPSEHFPFVFVIIIFSFSKIYFVTRSVDITEETLVRIFLDNRKNYACKLLIPIILVN